MLGGSNACQHCFCSSPIIQNPPTFLLCCLSACLANNSKQFELHSQFWKLLRDIGLWQHPHHLQNIRKFTTKYYPRKIFLPRIIPSSNYYIEIHDGTFPLIKILPKPKGDPVHELSSDFLAQFQLYHVTSCRHFTHHTSIICYNGTSW